jgi:hypothetical protein
MMPARIGALKATIVGAASSAATWFKQKLGIRSPSRVFAGFGGYMMQGLSNGIARGAGEPVRRIGNLSRDLTAALAVGTALPALTPAGAASLSGPNIGSGSGAFAAAPITINVYGAPGQSEQALAAAVERALARAQGRQRAMSQSSFADRPDGADL